MHTSYIYTHIFYIIDSVMLIIVPICNLQTIVIVSLQLNFSLYIHISNIYIHIIAKLYFTNYKMKQILINTIE